MEKNDNIDNRIINNTKKMHASAKKTLADIKKKIPKGGLMDPGLRKEKTPFNPANLKMGCW